MRLSRGGRRLAWVAASFLVISLVTRIGLALFSEGRYGVGDWAHFLGLGLLFDVTVLPWLLLPWALYEALMPDFAVHGRLVGWEARFAGLWGYLYLAFFLLVAAAEFAFWGEFNSRFDFIAVDYLIYTNEVLGNIAESYPIGWWLAAIGGAALVGWWFTWPRRRGAAPSQLLVRLGRPVAVLAAIAAGVVLVDPEMTDSSPDAFVQQLSLNGIMAFAHAYTHNTLDYDRYYPSLAAAELDPEIRSLLQEKNSRFIDPEGIDRVVTARSPLKKANVVLISVESLSAEFLGRFGNKEGLTPELDRLAGEGLLFTNFYATGTRTVRGLEALSVGTPPTPGQSIVRRPNNNDLENLGEELKEKGWKPFWIYGGYGFFDNMNAYFEANNYEVVDRSDADSEGVAIHHENIWGIADEDLYSLAIAKFDRAYAGNAPFFAHIMTTSNHRPYTFPEDRVDLPQKHREGAVKYTDWAIGDFIRRSAEKPWFENTVFIITADHTSKAAGRNDLPPDRYLIPMIWYAPALIKPAIMPRLMSQIDVGPTLMGWLGLDYDSRFFGYDIFDLEPGRERAFISTYQKLGYLKAGRMVLLDVNRQPVVVPVERSMATDGAPAPSDQQLIKEAIAWYQSASRMFRSGLLKDLPQSARVQSPPLPPPG